MNPANDFLSYWPACRPCPLCLLVLPHMHIEIQDSEQQEEPVA